MKAKQVKKVKKTESISHYVGILMENMDSKFQLAMEQNVAFQASMTKEISEFRGEVNERFSLIELAITHHSKEIRGLEKRVGNVEIKVDSLGKKVDNLEKKVDNMDIRLGKVEVKVDDIGEGLHKIKDRVEKHDEILSKIAV